MDWIATTIDAFGRAMGMDSLGLDEDGVVAMEIEGGAELAIHDLRPLGAPELLVSLTKAVSGPRETALRTALRLGDFRRSGQWAVQVALDGDELVIGVRLPIAAVMLSSLEEAVHQALSVHQGAEHGT